MITDFESKEINSVADLLAIMDQKLYSSLSRPIYRGHANKEWNLIPAVGRLLNTKNFQTNEKVKEFEKNAFAEFFIRNYHHFREGDKIVNLVIAQHHGLKTRLLDWTFSPLIGLFFAVENESHYDKDGVLFTYENDEGYNTYDQEKFDPLDEGTFSHDYHFINSPSLTPRISAQQGVLQLFKNPEKEFAKSSNLLAIMIPAKCKVIIKRELFNLGIFYDTIYPDPDGIAKSINYYKLNAN